jgi:hypothetical protein
MELGAFFLILALLILVGLFVSRPFFEPDLELAQEVSTSLDDRKRSALLAERDRILIALQELDFDHALGKIPEEDYPQQREGLMKRGALILRQLDEIQQETYEQDIEDRLETAIAARRADLKHSDALGAEKSVIESTAQTARVRGVSASVANPDDDLEVMLANRRRAQQEKAAGFCTKCGGPVKKSDQFCPKCGAKLS